MTGLPWIHSNEAEIFISNKTSFLCPNFAYPLKVTGASGGLLGKICQIFSTFLKICYPLHKLLPLFIHLCIGDTIVACGGVDENHYSTDLCFSLQAGCSISYT